MPAYRLPEAFPGLMLVVKHVARMKYGVDLDELLKRDDILIEVLKEVAGNSWIIVYRYLKGHPPSNVTDEDPPAPSRLKNSRTRMLC